VVAQAFLFQACDAGLTASAKATARLAEARRRKPRAALV